MGKIKIKRKSSRLKNKSFYIALSVCLIAFGLSFYTAISQIQKPDVTDTPSHPPSSAPSSSLHEVDKTVSNVVVPEEEAVTHSDLDTDLNTDSITAGTTPLFSFPVTGEITKDFDSKALQFSQTFQDWRLHLGVDIAAETGTPIYSCSYGTVEDIYEDRSLGTVVAIDHGEGLMAYYCGLNGTTVVSVEDEVQPGTQIGILDVIPSECEESAHLHFAMEKDGIPISPLSILQQYN